MLSRTASCYHLISVIGGLGGETAVGPGDHVLPTHQLGVSGETLSDKFGVFDDVARVSDHPWDEHLALGSFTFSQT